MDWHKSNPHKNQLLQQSLPGVSSFAKTHNQRGRETALALLENSSGTGSHAPNGKHVFGAKAEDLVAPRGLGKRTSNRKFTRSPRNPGDLDYFSSSFLGFVDPGLGK